MPRPKTAKSPRILIGLTGSFGSGKTTVAKMFKRHGALVLDADKLAHEYLLPGTPSYRRIVRLFGRGIVRKDHRIDRAKLGEIAFGNEALLLGLNAIVHPAVTHRLRRELRAADARVVVLDVPLLIESGLDKEVDYVAVVTLPRHEQIARVAGRTGLSKAAILRRIRTQLPARVKARAADFIIDNSGSIKQTQKQVTTVWKKLEGMWKS